MNRALGRAVHKMYTAGASSSLRRFADNIPILEAPAGCRLRLVDRPSSEYQDGSRRVAMSSTHAQLWISTVQFLRVPLSDPRRELLQTGAAQGAIRRVEVVHYLGRSMLFDIGQSNLKFAP